MYVSLKCVALRTIRHSDTGNILQAWSAERGPVSLSLSAASTPEARRRRALTMPLALFEVVVRDRPGAEILSVRELRPLDRTVAVVDSSPAKAMQRFFLAEVLNALLRESNPPEHLAEFLFESVRTLARIRSPHAVANFHLLFLLRLSRFMGVEPDLHIPAGTQSQRLVLDLREGSFRSSLPLHRDFILGREARLAACLARAEWHNVASLKFSRAERARALDIILSYYHIHLMPRLQLRTMDVLRNLCL